MIMGKEIPNFKTQISKKSQMTKLHSLNRLIFSGFKIGAYLLAHEGKR